MGKAGEASVTPTHHPSNDTLFAYGVGALAPGAALTVALHADGCPLCAKELQFLETIGGGVLDTIAPEPVGDEVLHRALSAIDRAAKQPRPKRDMGRPLPPALEALDIGPWRWAGHGLKLASIRDAGAKGEYVYLLLGQPGAVLAPHTHSGMERVAVLEGAFADEAGNYEAGDLAECDGRNVHHAPVVLPRGDCLCLVATEGPLKLRGIAALLQPYFGI